MAVEPPGWGALLIAPAEPEPAAVPGAEETVQIARTASLLMTLHINNRIRLPGIMPGMSPVTVG